MKIRALLATGLFLALAAFAPLSLAQQDISGTWQGKLQIAPGNEIGIQFILKKQADGTYAATVNSPDNESIKNVPASKVQFAANKLSLTVDALSGSYEGTWDKNAITGKWKQPGSDLPLNLKQYVKTEVSKADMKKLLGSWVGNIIIPSSPELLTVVKFETGADGKITGNLTTPENNPQVLPVTDIELTENTLEFQTPRIKGRYSGTLKGTKLEGTWFQIGQKFPLNMSKGEYVSKPAIVKLPDEIKRQLTGEWVGSLKTPQMTIATVFRFASSAAGEFTGAVSTPEISPAAQPFKEMVFTDKGLSLKIPSAGVEYTAELKKDGSIDTIEGTWKQGAQTFPLIMKKGKYVAPPPPTLTLSADAMRALKGSWRGKLDTTVIIRFETTTKGEHLGFLSNPEVGIKDLPINEATLTGSKLTFRITRGGIEYTGDLAGNKLTGQWKRGDTSKPLVLTRE